MYSYRPLREIVREIIGIKLQKSLWRLDKHIDVLKEVGININEISLTAYFLGILRAIAYDVTLSIESRALTWREYKELAIGFVNIIRKEVKNALD